MIKGDVHMNIVERFIGYVKYDTKSDEESTTVPSTKVQLVFAKELVKELEKIGLKDVSLDENGYIMATLPSNIDKETKTIGFIAHMDTSPDFCGTNVNPKIVENYDGKDIVLNPENGIVLSPKEFPELKDYVGKTLITTDGTTLLGGDDKAGIAEIVTAMEYLVNHPEIKHGTIRVAFTPDEEVGRGADHFDVEKFNANLAYTIDGGVVGELEYESFNAASAKIIINGCSVHPGYSKNKMVNSILLGNEFASKLPENEIPACTEGYEGFYHLKDFHGSVEKTRLDYIIRDFDRANFEKRKEKVVQVVDELNKKYGEGTIILELKDQYYNMKEKIEAEKYIMDIAYKAMEELGITPIVQPIRGGTDGSRLSFMGLPTPNIFTGTLNGHGKYEFIPVFAMEKAVEVILKITEAYTRH